MSLVEVNGFPASRVAMQLPLSGVGYADIKIAEHPSVEPVKVNDPVEMIFESGESFHLTCTRAGREIGFWRISALLGAAGLGKSLDAKFYTNIPARTVVRDIVESVGEQVDSISITDIYPHYVRLASKANQALHTVLLPYDDLSWRMTPEGKLWVGEEAWPGVPDIQIVHERPDNRSVELIFNPKVLPGQLSAYGQIDRVSHFIQPRSLRTEIRYRESR